MLSRRHWRLHETHSFHSALFWKIFVEFGEYYNSFPFFLHSFETLSCGFKKHVWNTPLGGEKSVNETLGAVTENRRFSFNILMALFKTSCSALSFSLNLLKFQLNAVMFFFFFVRVFIFSFSGSRFSAAPSVASFLLNSPGVFTQLSFSDSPSLFFEFCLIVSVSQISTEHS